MGLNAPSSIGFGGMHEVPLGDGESLTCRAAKIESFTVEFRDPTQPRKVTRELIDHILMTPAAASRMGWLKFVAGSGVIGHAASAKYTDNKGAKPDERPSDHVPVWADFEF